MNEWLWQALTPAVIPHDGTCRNFFGNNLAS
jgi:hypothetical protein